MNNNKNTVRLDWIHSSNPSTLHTTRHESKSNQSNVQYSTGQYSTSVHWESRQDTDDDEAKRGESPPFPPTGGATLTRWAL